jgi:ATP-binding protein involved in chromosome partitioning
MGCDFLGEVPLDIAVRETSDGGRPIVASQPDGAIAQVYRGIAAKVAAKIEQALARSAQTTPRIVIQ